MYYQFHYYSRRLGMSEILASRIRSARVAKGLSQGDVARQLGITQGAVSALERSASRLSWSRATELARLFDQPLQWLLTGTVHPPTAPRDLALELTHFGLSDLVTASAQVPGAFRHFEEVAPLALVGEPSPRIVDALPLLFLVNVCQAPLLAAFAETYRVARRVGWIVDVAATLVESGLHHPAIRPEIVTLRNDLAARIPRSERSTADSLGSPADSGTTLSIVHRRWNVNYDQTMEGFRRRAFALLEKRP
jgi:transcriptional regulator with XRE-family HTH domain